MICLFFMFKRKEATVDLNEIPNPGYEEPVDAAEPAPMQVRTKRPNVNDVRNPAYDEPAKEQDNTDEEDE